MADFPAYAAMWADPKVSEYFRNFVATRESSWLRFGRCEGLWALLGFGPFTVEEKATGDYVGDVGPADYKRDTEPRLDGPIEFGWALASRHFGKGYATEAVRAAMYWTDATQGRKRLIAIIAPSNEPSFAVARKVGFSLAGDILFMGLPTILYTREV
jgi:RimJ/RimL family protein N-acetyltransferase